jgi:hypothetical protein
MSVFVCALGETKTDRIATPIISVLLVFGDRFRAWHRNDVRIGVGRKVVPRPQLRNHIHFSPRQRKGQSACGSHLNFIDESDSARCPGQSPEGDSSLVAWQSNARGSVMRCTRPTFRVLPCPDRMAVAEGLQQARGRCCTRRGGPVTSISHFGYSLSNVGRIVS